MKVAFVSPRYGVSVFGGAELGTRQLAEHLASQPGWSAEVYTTCALDHMTWDDVLPSGDAMINGVIVHRFVSEAGRSPDFNQFYARLAPAPRAASMEDARRWVEMQGPVTPELVDAVSESDADVVAFYPYLYYPTVFGIGRVSVPAVLHPAAHDEPAFYLPVFAATFRCADAFAYHTVAERELVQHRHPVADAPQVVLGLGVDPPVARGRSGRDVLETGDRPYVVSVGRVDAQKGSQMLVRFFRAYKERHPGPLTLVLVGPVNEVIDAGPDVIVTGPLDEQDKVDVVRDAVVSISPSPYESFSLTVMESAAVRVPVLVNGACEATTEFCQRSQGGLTFTSFHGFEIALDRLLLDARLRRALAERGNEYVARQYTWDAVIDRYTTFLSSVAGRPKKDTAFAGVARSAPAA